MLHWVLNDNTCILSVLEHKIRQNMNNGIPINKNDCFTARLINPIYDFKKNNKEYSVCIYLLTTCLWAVSLGKLYYNYKSGKIKSLEELFRR